MDFEIAWLFQGYGDFAILGRFSLVFLKTSSGGPAAILCESAMKGLDK